MSQTPAFANPFAPFRYNKFSRYLRERFGCRVQKIPLNAGLSCPNRREGGQPCIYCGAQGAGSKLGRQFPSLRQQLLAGIQNTPRRYPDCRYIAYFQAFSNTYAPVKTLEELYRQALDVDRRIIGLAVSTRPDCLSEQVWELLAAYARRCYFWLELGLQSACDKTLRRIGRGHDRRCFGRAVKKAQSLGLRVCAHVILGLPGEGRREIIRSARYLSALGVQGVKIHNLYVLRDTGLWRMYRRGEYRPLSRGEYASLAADFLRHLSPRIVIQRLAANPPHDLLAAPAWSLKKALVIRAVERCLQEQNAWQGSAWQNPRQR